MISRHETLRNDILINKIKRHEKLWEQSYTVVLENPGNALGTKIVEFRNILGVTLVAEMPQEQSLRYLKMLKEVGSAYFLFGTLDSQQIEASVDGKTYQFIGKKMTAFMDTDSWITVFMAAIILRDMEAIHELVQVPESTFIEANLQPIAFDLGMVRLLKGLYTKDADLTELLYTALDLSDPEKIDKERFPYISYVLYPLLGLLLSTLSNKEEEFNEKLEAALYQHKKFWSGKRTKLDPSGWFSLHLSAIAAIAHDQKGFEIKVQSDYLPLWMVNKDF